MRKLILSLVVMLGLLVEGFCENKIQTIIDIPNLKAAWFSNADGNTGLGAESTMLKYSAICLNVGYVKLNGIDNTWTGSLALNLDELDKLGVKNVQYLWTGVKTSVGIWYGYSFTLSQWSWGANISLIQVNF